MAKALHIRARRQLSKTLHQLLAKIFPPKYIDKMIEDSEIKRILVVRINYRIGNILFTTPLLNALEKQFPNTQIDMMVGAPFTAPLIEDMPQITNVYSFPRALLKKPLEVMRLRKSLKQNNYDLLVVPNLTSSSDTLFTFMVNAKYKLGFYAPNVFSPLTHAMHFPKDIKHEALRPLALMKAFQQEEVDHDAYLDICLSHTEKKRVKDTIATSSIGIFRDARGEKKIDDTWWTSLVQKLQTLDTTLNFIDILDPNNQIPLYEDIQILSEKNLRTLAAKLSHLDAFICADTGPMHLASASITPTIALFKTTSPTYYGTLGENDLSLVIKDKSIDEVANQIMEHLQSARV